LKKEKNNNTAILLDLIIQVHIVVARKKGTSSVHAKCLLCVVVH